MTQGGGGGGGCFWPHPVPSPNHLTTREVPEGLFFKFTSWSAVKRYRRDSSHPWGR